MNIAERNRQIKKLVKRAFPGYKVSVTGGRGTATGWVDIEIDYQPLDSDQSQELKGLVARLLDKAGIEFFHHWSDDNSDTARPDRSITFLHSRFRRTFRGNSGILWGEPWDCDGEFVRVTEAQPAHIG